MAKSIKTRIMDAVEALPSKQATTKQLKAIYAAITGKDLPNVSLNLALTDPDSGWQGLGASRTRGYLRKPGYEPRHLTKIGRALYALAR